MNVRTVKFTFILLALGLTVLLFAWPNNEDHLSLSTQMKVEPNSNDLKSAGVSNMASTVMEEPNFTGENGEDRWGVKALRAVQSHRAREEIMKLEKVEAYFVSKKGEPVTFQAAEGLFKGIDKGITLIGNVEIKGYGYTLTTNHIEGNMQLQTVTSENSVSIKGLKGTVLAGSMDMNGMTGHIILSQGVKMHIYPQKTFSEYNELDH